MYTHKLLKCVAAHERKLESTYLWVNFLLAMSMSSPFQLSKRASIEEIKSES